MRFLSVCSGIEAASVAWHPLGWSAVGFSEIEKFPCEVLSQHYGSNMPGEPLCANGVPNLGDMSKFEGWPDYAIRLLVGGTPCQSFSIAGLRKGLADPRGNLMLTYLAIARRYRPEWLVWENVPGVLSSNGGRDFATFIGGLEECGYHAAWRVLDAQYVRVDGYGRAVPQRRRRVFVVGHLGDWRRAAAVLFEREGLQGHPAPRREAWQGVAPTISARTKGGGGLGTDFDCDGGLIAADVAGTLPAGGNKTGGDRPPGMGQETADTMLVAHALRAEGFDASEDGTGRGTPLVPICFSSKDYGNDAQQRLAPTLRSMNNSSSHANAGGQLAIAIQERAGAENLSAGPGGKGYQEGVAYTLEARNKVQSVAFDTYNQTITGDVAQTLCSRGDTPGGNGHLVPAIATQWAVRRLTPMECERLQGFPDGYTLIDRNGKPAADGPRYKALGNSMAVNVMRWIGRRIEMVNQI